MWLVHEDDYGDVDVCAEHAGYDDWREMQAEYETRCPECTQGKHRNCTGWALDAADVVVECACDECNCPLVDAANDC